MQPHAARPETLRLPLTMRTASPSAHPPKPEPKSLKDRALIVKLSIPRWNPKRNDPRGEEIIRSATNGQGHVGVWSKHCVPPAEVKRITHVASRARSYNYALTLPWKDGGLRLLPITTVDRYMRTVDQYREQFTEAVDAFLERYPRLIEDAQDRLGSLYNPEDYPAPEDLAARFDFRVSIHQISDSPDIRVHSFPADIAQKLREDMKRDASAAKQQAHRDIWRRLAEIATRLAETLGDPKKHFRNSLVTRSDQLLEAIHDLNIFEDPNAERVRQALQAILRDQTTGRQINPDRFRTDAAHRQQAATAAAAQEREVHAILERFGL